MSIEKFYEEEKKKKEKELNYREIYELKEKKEKIANYEKTSKKLYKLKQMLEKWEVDKETIIKVAKELVWEDEFQKQEIQEIFETIDEIEDIPDIDNCIPKDLRITKDEYKKALQDNIFREKALKKVNKALGIIADKITPDSSYWISILADLVILDKNLIKAQEKTIEVKQSLKSKTKLSFWQKIKEFFS